MNKSITQANQNDKQISKSIEKFFKRFHISSALKASNAYKKKGIPVINVIKIIVSMPKKKPTCHIQNKQVGFFHV